MKSAEERQSKEGDCNHDNTVSPGHLLQSNYTDVSHSLCNIVCFDINSHKI